jgi:hypothetical protein
MNRHQLDRIRLVSTRFRELQGLCVAVAGAAMAFIVGGYALIARRPSNDGAMLAVLLAFVLAAPAVWSLNRYYAARFGRQLASRRMAGRTALALVAYVVVAATLNARFEAIPAGAPTAVTVALASLWISIRDWPWRAYYLGATAAVAIGFAASTPITGLLPPHMTLTTIFVLLGASMVPIGLLDHLTLVRLVDDVRELQQAAE